MARWEKSGLKAGDRVRIPEKMLISGESKRFIKAEYEDETKRGLMLKFYFEAGLSFDDEVKENTWYRVFISWESIYCGEIRLKDMQGHDIKAVRIFGRRRTA